MMPIKLDIIDRLKATGEKKGINRRCHLAQAHKLTHIHNSRLYAMFYATTAHKGSSNIL